MKTRVRSEQNKWENSLRSDAIDALYQPSLKIRFVYENRALRNRFCENFQSELSLLL
jgi:hypothetical protein